MSKKKERRIEGPVAKERKRRIHCQEPANSFVSGGDRAEKYYLLFMCCVAIE